MTTINHGDPEPARTLTLLDKHGDVWTWDPVSKAWTSYETAPFPWHRMRKPWFPMEVFV